MRTESKHFALERHETSTGDLLDWTLYRKIGKGKAFVESIQLSEAKELADLLYRVLDDERILDAVHEKKQEITEQVEADMKGGDSGEHKGCQNSDKAVET
jgi:hypothetical protein